MQSYTKRAERGWDRVDRTQFGKLLNEARLAKGVTVEALAEACDVSAAYMQKILSGKRGLGLDLLLKICNNLTVSPQYLLQGDLCLPDGGEDIRPLVDRLTPHARRPLKAVLNSIMKARD